MPRVKVAMMHRIQLLPELFTELAELLRTAVLRGGAMNEKEARSPINSRASVEHQG